MIHRLLIKNYALIEHLDINFDDGLTIITGETGAGKSILLGALGMILGNRADTKVLYNDTEKCIIEGYFDVSNYDLKDFFEENEVDYDVNTVVRRELTPQGKTRSFINDTPVNLNQLRAFTGKLVDLHQQFDTMEISDPSFQLQMIDALADNKSPLIEYKKLYAAYQSNKRKLSELIEQSARSSKEIEFWKFQLNELEQSALVEGEQEQYETNLTRLQNGENIKRQLTAGFRALVDDENAIAGQMRSVAQSIAQVKKFNPEIAEQHKRLESLMFELDDIGSELERLSEDTEYNPEQIQTFQSRLDIIYRLQKKHNVNSVADLLNIQNEFQSQLNAVADSSENIEQLKLQLSEQEIELTTQAENLSKRRQAVAPDFSERVIQRLRLLGMEQSQMAVVFSRLVDQSVSRLVNDNSQTNRLTDQPTNRLNADGYDDVQFMFAANRGSRLQPIKDVASGGELSRLALCAKSLVAAAIPLPTMIFDEIDSGVSGDIALKMGNILQQLATHHQIVVITHSPQVAAKANKHYFVYKTLQDDRTFTKVRLLEYDERVRAIATMLSQNPPSSSALENAKELMSEKIPIV